MGRLVRVPDATATATLDDRFMAESVVVENGADTYEFTYGDYRDWNNPLHPAEAFYAGRMTERKNGAVVRGPGATAECGEGRNLEIRFHGQPPEPRRVPV